MAGWDFDQAEALAAVATGVLDVRDDIAGAVEPLGPEWGLAPGAPAALEAAYESAEDDDALSDLDTTAGATLDAARSLASTGRAVAADRGLVETIGLVGRDVDAAFTRAVAEFEDGDPAGAIEQAGAVDRMLEGATPAGRLRLAIALALAVSVVVAALLLSANVGRIFPKKGKDQG
jgi:hypothetical protein